MNDDVTKHGTYKATIRLAKNILVQSILLQSMLVRTVRQTDRQTPRQIDRQTDEQTDMEVIIGELSLFCGTAGLSTMTTQVSHCPQQFLELLQEFVVFFS